ncbi:hypothetical protein FACS1894161_1660 [Spirochaetia bacterium]|nr:hypothetical protein FACS1894161_1660 [Spirochaetia bacterium]
MSYESADWMETKYRESLEEDMRGLERRLENDPGCTVEELEGTLRNLYVMSGADWGGRGEVQNITLDATIAAYETIISRLQRQRDAAT